LALLRAGTQPNRLIGLPAGGREPKLNAASADAPAATLRKPRAALRPPPALPSSGLHPTRSPGQTWNPQRRGGPHPAALWRFAPCRSSRGSG
jgi:hypothetical protein